MPKIVDHDQRRRHIATAVLRIVGDEGVHAATLRRVASESGVPMSTIQHYFRTTQAMLEFALQMQEAAKAQRIGVRVRAEWENGPRAVLEGIFDEVLPLDPDRLRETAVGTAYYVAWRHDEALKARLLQDIPAAREGLAAVVREGQRLGLIDARREADREAEVLFALTDAVGSGIVVGYHDAPAALAMCSYYLDRLFTQ